MNIRLYCADKDFEKLKSWISDERTSAMWCGGRISFPMTEEAIDKLISAGNTAHIAESDEGEPLGFYCTAVLADAIMLKFVVTAPEMRGKGLGARMVALAAERELSARKTDTVRLCVFVCNKAALKCYTKAGFAKKLIIPNAFTFKNEVWERIIMEKH